MAKIIKLKLLLEMQSNKNSHKFLLGMQNDRTTLEKNLVVSYEVKYIFTI